MKRFNLKRSAWAPLVLAALLIFIGVNAWADIIGEPPAGSPGAPVFNLKASPGYISTSDGDSFLMWGYSLESRLEMQYPGPTMIVNEGDVVTVTLKNMLPVEAGNVSIVFPGHVVAASGGSAGLLTREAPPDGGTTMVTYTFTATQPGTYLYRSGTRPDLQVEMGLVGALIVRPALGPNYAYNHADTMFDHEFLYLLTEMDPVIHRQVEYGQYDQIDTSRYFATNWFINGRNFPDLMAANNAPWLPTQPYNCQPIMNVGDRVLIRCIGAGRELHPMHFHGNDFETIAVDGRILTSGSGAPDLSWQATTIKFAPGQTADVIWSWNAANLGWDIYGHAPGDPPVAGEFMPDHGKPFPVVIPTRDSLSFGELYSGTPFIGEMGDLPPGHPGLNDLGGFFYMWHSHTEKELTSNDIWPGGLVSFMIVVHPDMAHP